jgi:hypothetical protein
MKIKSLALLTTLAVPFLSAGTVNASTVHVVNASDETMRVFFRGLHAPQHHVEAIPAKTSADFVVKGDMTSGKNAYQAIGMSCYGKGPDWQLVGTHCGTLHKDKNYTVYIEKDEIGGTRTICTEHVPSV